MIEQELKGRQLIARLDRIPIWPFPQHYYLIIGIGFFFGFFDILTIGFALPRIEVEFHITLQTAAWTITSSLIGYIVGSYFISRIADNKGRKIALIFSMLLFTIGSFACAFSFDFIWLVFLRFITGMGIGAEIDSVTSYMSELAPEKVRGRSTCIAIACGMMGFAVIPLISYWLVPNFAYGWRILFLIGGLGGGIIFFTRRHLPDSPRWLVINNQVAEAEEIINKAEALAISKLQTALPEPAKIETHPMIHDVSLKNFLNVTILKRIALFVLIWFIYYIGNYAWLTLAPSLLVHHGFALANSIKFILIASIGFVVGSIISVYICDRLERKWLAFITAIIWSITLLIIGLFPTPMVIITCGFVITITIATIIPIMYIYTGENFPTRIRATSLSITDGLGHLGGAFCSQIIFFFTGLFSHTSSFSIAFYVMATTGFITAILFIFGLNMTKKSLADLSK